MRGGLLSDSSDKLFGLLLTFSFFSASRASLYRTVRAEQSHWWVSEILPPYLGPEPVPPLCEEMKKFEVAQIPTPDS